VTTPIPTRHYGIKHLAEAAEQATKADEHRTAVIAYTLLIEKAVASRTRSVQAMRDNNYSWGQIAKALDVSAQAAWERYSHSGPVTDPLSRTAVKERRRQPSGRFDGLR
jgi:hypothetical protein